MSQVQDHSGKPSHEEKKQGWALVCPATAGTGDPGLSQNRSLGLLGPWAGVGEAPGEVGQGQEGLLLPSGP